ncbi:putative kinesin-like protein [Podospora australis]|uniref:Kinesin-like protein n=1 Tax=Podospora australis TaxID=1536484 RepID=A0AAN7AK93_9PEZI|nr:putative kinesin-like protein [Podospora australis]
MVHLVPMSSSNAMDSAMDEVDPQNSTIPLVPLDAFRCPGEVNKPSSFTPSALHQLRRRAVERFREDPPNENTTTSPRASTASGALLLSSFYLLRHLILPRMGNLNMDGASENANFRSGIRAPRVHTTSSTITAMTLTSGTHTSGTLQEITNSEHNARAHATGTKRTYTGAIPLPEPKTRKTLADRGGEPIPKSQLPSAGPNAAARLGIKPTSIANLATTHHPPAAANSSRPASAIPGASRHAPTANFGKSVGPGSRPPISSRAPTSTGFHQGSTTGTRGASRQRPATSMGNRRGEDDAGQQGQPVQQAPQAPQQSWDVDGRLSEFETQFKVMKEAFDSTLTDRKAMEDMIDFAKQRATELERDKQQLRETNHQLESHFESMRQENYQLQKEKQQLMLQFEAEQTKHGYELQGKEAEQQRAVDSLKAQFSAEVQQMKQEHQHALESLERQYQRRSKDEKEQQAKEIEELRKRLGAEQQDMNLVVKKKEQEIEELRSQVESLKLGMDREHRVKEALQQQVTEMATTNMTLESGSRALRAKIEFLESGSKQQSDAFADMEARLQEALRVAEEAREKLIKEETERRVLFNKYQELKGNIRVMCRVRPVLNPAEGDAAAIAFPDQKTSAQIEVTGSEERTSIGTVSRKVLPFEFDRVFSPAVRNDKVFDEISQLVQSALDGYNVCIFCYGQTGSGKTYTMSSPDGMIPRATHMIYETVTKLREKSWTYTMEGSFVEVYNEELRDLLTPAKEVDPKKKLEIRHDERTKQTTVLNCKSVPLDSPNRVEQMLKQAQNNRSVAATKANERSSRSHSVFILKLVGENSATHERCEGTLNLVDLAGSERLNHSQAEGDRMRETQNINKSLACLGDVIEALGRGSAHIPYRNSKLTHLLQYSLGGNSKTLMFVMVSPMEAHLKETITSLRFATKVHNTHIGTAKSTKKLTGKERNSESRNSDSRASDY